MTELSPKGTLILDYVKENYVAIAEVSAGFSYPVTNSCDGPTTGPANPVFLDGGVGSSPRPPVRVGSRSRGRAPPATTNFIWIQR